jgi:hypothetical protein
MGRSPSTSVFRQLDTETGMSQCPRYVVRLCEALFCLSGLDLPNLVARVAAADAGGE